MIDEPLSPTQQRMRLATAVRNAATTQCIFSPWPGCELAFRDGALYQMVPGTSQYQRQYVAPLLRIEELIGMSDDEIWAKIMGGQH
jgi:hypothetical protein